MRELFFRLIGGMAQRHGFCVECLGSLYGEPVENIRTYLEGVESSPNQCDNCWERRETFRVGPT